MVGGGGAAITLKAKVNPAARGTGEGGKGGIKWRSTVLGGGRGGDSAAFLAPQTRIHTVQGKKLTVSYSRNWRFSQVLVCYPPNDQI